MQRTIRLPDTADADRIVARVEHGVLDVDIPKKQLPQQRRRQIDIAGNDAPKTAQAHQVDLAPEESGQA